MQNSEMFRQRVTHTGFDTLASSHPLFSFFPPSFFYVFFLFSFFPPTILNLIIHVYDAVDTYVRELVSFCLRVSYNICV